MTASTWWMFELTLQKFIFQLLCILLTVPNDICTPEHLARRTYPNDKQQTSFCDYGACDLGAQDMVNIHLIPHSHDDVGWLKTVDQYYYGSLNAIQRAGVQYILDNVIQALVADQNRRFTYVEMAYFHRWWKVQPEVIREKVRQLVTNGQLQFALGGWSMADEATVHYTDAIDQLTVGHSMLSELFGECGRPRVAWQIDPFGHARDIAALFQDAGFDGVYFQRMDYREKWARRERRELEILWDSGMQLNTTGKGLFTGMFYDSYCFPAGFCFDEKCLDPPMQDNPDLKDYNIPYRVNDFISYVNRIRSSFATNHVIVPWGCDFTYENAIVNFKNTDKLIYYVNKEQSRGSKINVLYSTPQCYTKAVNQAFLAKGNMSRRGGDFFPYASGYFSYWTGYYTSRPSLKNSVRKASNLLTACEHMNLFGVRILATWNTKLRARAEAQITSLRYALGVMQHHDAVTGTEKQHVTNDYVQTLVSSCAECEGLFSQAIYRLMPWMDHLTGSKPIVLCNHLNISFCNVTDSVVPRNDPTTEGGGVYILVYNPTGRAVWNQWIRIPIHLPSIQKRRRVYRVVIKDSRNWETDSLPYQLIPITKRTKEIPERQIFKPKANEEVIFNVASLGPPLPGTGFSIFHLYVINQRHIRQHYLANGHRQQLRPSPAQPVCNNLPLVSQTTSLYLEVGKNSEVSPLKVIGTHVLSGFQLELGIDLFVYNGETSGGQPSGAYVFRPRSYTSAQRIGTPSVKVYNGSCVQEVHLTYSTWATLVVRLYSNGELETEWTAGPLLDEFYSYSRELIVRYTVTGEGIQPEVDGEFFTDSAGRRLIRRIRNARPDWNLPDYTFKETEPIAGNYYPIINRIMLKGRKPPNSNHRPDIAPAMAFAVYTDRAQGGTSLENGQLEIMLHRRLVKDDGFGVGEPLMENGVDGKGLIVRGKHILRLDERTVIEDEDSVMGHRVSRPPILLFAPSHYQPTHGSEIPWTALNVTLPFELHLISLIAWPLHKTSNGNLKPADQILIRLEHIGFNLIKGIIGPVGPAKLKVDNLLKGIRVTRATSMTLTAMQKRDVAQANRLHWPTEDSPDVTYRQRHLNRFSNSQFSSADSWSGEINSNGAVSLIIRPGEIATYILDYTLL